MKRLLFAAPLLLAACAAVPPPAGPVTGEWGGMHVALHLSDAGGTLDYDCAHGTIGPIIPGPGGRFNAEGSHTPEHGGPVRQGEIVPSWPVHYSGTITHDRMILEGREASGVALGPFELRRGAPPTIFRCL